MNTTVSSPSGSLSNSSTSTVTESWQSGGHGHARVMYPVLAVLNVLLVLFLYCYVRRMLRGKGADDGGTPGAGGGDDYEASSSAESSPSTSARKDKLSADVLPSLPVFVYLRAGGEEALECAVCLTEFGDGERGRLLPRCEHRFHVDCVDVWFRSHSTCPVCRSPAEPKLEPAGDDAV